MRVALKAPFRTVGELAAILGITPLRVGEPPEEIVGLATDSREVKGGDLFVALHGARQEGECFVPEALSRGAVAILAEKPPALFEADYTVLCVGDVQEALLTLAAERRRRSAAKVIAVSGSTGKTTAKELIAAILATAGSVQKSEGNFNSHIGMPLSLLGMKNADYFVLELGINHRGEMARLARALSPDVAVLTNVGTAHVGHFSDACELFREKMKITEGLRENGTLLVGESIPSSVRHTCGVKTLVFGTGDGADFRVSNVQNGKKGAVADVIWQERILHGLSWPVAGSIGASAIGIGAGVGLLEGLTEKQIKEGFLAAKSTTPRMRRLEIHGRRVIDDTYNASPEAMVGALEALIYQSDGCPSAAVFGDMLELGGGTAALHDAVGECAARSGISHFFAYGDQRGALSNGALRGGMSAACVHPFAFGEERALAEEILRSVPRGGFVLFKASRGTALDLVIKELELL